MQLRFPSFFLILAGFCVNAASQKSSRLSSQSRAQSSRPHKMHVPPQFLNLDPNKPLMTQLIQEDYIVSPDDFANDPDVAYVLNELHRNQTVDKFYRTAQTVYNDLELFYKELASTPQLAVEFHDCMKRMTTASLSKPLTVTNLILGITHHFRPLFRTRSKPFEDLARLVIKLELDPDLKMIRLMSQFFQVYTIREMDQIQNLINLASYAGVDPFTARHEAKLKREESNGSNNFNEANDSNEDYQTSQASSYSHPAHPIAHFQKGIKPKLQRKSKSKSKSRQSTTDASLEDDNYFENFLKPVSDRSRIIIANAVTKMLILLDLFVNDSSMAARSVQLYIKLWIVHSRRLAAREKVDIDDLDVRWVNSSLYRKFPISFLYDDWAPGILSLEEMAELRQAAIDEAREDQEYIDKEDANISKAKFYSNLFSIGSVLLIITAVTALAYFAFLKYRQSKQSNEDEDEDEDDDEKGARSEIVDNLERSI